MCSISLQSSGYQHGQRAPDPDSLLARIEHEARKAERGRLKVFLGAAAGVGKTYAMLQAAQALAKQGKPVLVGIIETHGRSETAALLQGLEVLPRPQVPYGNATLEEFDLDAVLKRHPPPGAGGRAGPQQPAGFAPCEALAGRGRAPGRRHRRLYHPQHPAHREPQRRGDPDHRHPRLGDGARHLLRARGRSGAGGSAAGRAPAAPEGRQDLPAAAGRTRDRELLPQGQPDRPAGAGPAPHRRPGGRADAGVPRGPCHRPGMGGARAGPGVHRPGPESETPGAGGKRLADSVRGEWIVVYIETPDLLRLPESQRKRRWPRCCAWPRAWAPRPPP